MLLIGQLQKIVVIEKHEKQHEQRPDGHADKLLEEIIGAGFPAHFRDIIAGRIDHHKPDAKQKHQGDDHRIIECLLIAHFALSLRFWGFLPPAAHGNHITTQFSYSLKPRTICLNTSPRCSKLSNISQLAQAGESSTHPPLGAISRARSTACSNVSAVCTAA